MAATMGDPAGAWVRVSSGSQDEANQVPDITRHCDGREYPIAKWYTLNDKSASKGEQQAMLDEMLADMRDGTIKVLVCWHSDRIERRGPEAMFRLLRLIRDAGGHLESVKEPLLGSADISGETLTAIGAITAHQYSVHLGEQVRLSHDRIRTNNALIGRAPWGYMIVGDKYDKKLVPIEECREIIREIFQRCAKGDSCATIARWLDSDHVPPRRNQRWNEGSVYQIIRNMTYAGRRQDEGPKNVKGRGNRKNRQTVMTCEPVISMDLWTRANDALRNRPRRGPGAASKRPDSPLLAGLKCARCEDSPMYRVGRSRTSKRTGETRVHEYYRCSGRQPDRKGCGNMVPLRQTELTVAVRFFITSDEPYQVREWVEGENWEEQILQIKQDIRELVEAERFSELPPLQAKLEDYRSRKTIPGHYERRTVHHPDGSVMTIGEHFDTLDRDGQREYLKTHDIRVEKTIPLLEPGVSCGIRVVIDGEDHGVFPVFND